MEKEQGHITFTVGLIRLCFKDLSGVRGNVFVRCTFTGRGASTFVPDIPPLEGKADQKLLKNTASPVWIPVVESEPVNITDRPELEGSLNPVVDEESASDAGEATKAHGEAPAIESSTIVVDGAFSIDSTKFDLTEGSLSMLETTEVQIEVVLDDLATEAKSVIGAASVSVANVLRGENVWSDELILGTYDGLKLCDAARASNTLLDPVGSENEDEMVTKEREQTVEDDSHGLLEFAGSTSTLRVTLNTDDGTADYTLGAGSLWMDGAEIEGIPESWKIQPPPETERSLWENVIAEKLAGQPKYSYSIWWGANNEELFDETTEERAIPLPSMRLDGGVLSYKSDNNTENTSTHGEFKGTSSAADGAVSSNGGGSAKEDVSTAPLDQPTGAWSVRFSSSRKQSAFLTRASIRALRRALMFRNLGGDGHDSCCGDKTLPGATAPHATLPVFLERRQLLLESPANAKRQGKGAKQGKKGGKGASPKQAILPPETPWLCKASVDLSLLVAWSGGQSGVEEGNSNGERKSPCAETIRTSDSPLRVELRAGLTLDALVDNPASTASGGMEGNGEAPAPLESQTLEDSMGDSDKTAAANLAETRSAQMEAAGTTLLIAFALTRPLMKAPAYQETSVSVRDVFVPKDVGPSKLARDVEAELTDELDGCILTVLMEYAKLFLEPGVNGAGEDELSVDEREKRLFYALNSRGVYHSILERLKPRVQRIVRKRFGVAPTDATEADAFVAEIYAYLVKQAAVVLNKKIKDVEAKSVPSYVILDAKKTLEERVRHLEILADDAEARAAYEEAAARHEDCIEAATAAAASREDSRIFLAHAWERYARFYLHKGQEPQHRDKIHLDQAVRCLEESLRVYSPGSEESLSATAVLAAVMLEQGQVDKASALLEHARARRLPEPEEGADGYETDIVASLVPPRDHALACLLRDRMGDASGARRSMFLAVLSSKRDESCTVTSAADSAGGEDEPGAPRRTTVRVMHEVCAWLLELGLPLTARQALSVAYESERVAVKKAQERGLPTRTSTSQRESFRRLESSLLVAEWTMNGGCEQNNRDGVAISDIVKAEILAQEATELLPGNPQPWQALAEAREARGALKASEAEDAWVNALDRLEEAWRLGSGSTPPLRVYMRLGALQNTLGKTKEAKACLLRGCRAWRAPGPWLGCGIACLRLEQWEEAEDAFQHASRLDCNSPLVWGHLALLLLSQGEDRLAEADRAFSQALRLGLSDASLLREIGTCYVAIDRLEDAENALRLSLSADVHGNHGQDPAPAAMGFSIRKGDGNPHTRRRLADVLSARNSSSQAVEEYWRVLESPSVDESERHEVLVRCGDLLRKIGREDELGKLRDAFPSSRAHSWQDQTIP